MAGRDGSRKVESGLVSARARTAQAMRASLLARAIANMLRWSRFDACSIQSHKPRIATLAAAPARRVRPARTVCPQIFVAALGDFAQDRAILSRLLLRYEPQPGAEVAPCVKPAPLPIATTTALEMIGSTSGTVITRYTAAMRSFNRRQS